MGAEVAGQGLERHTKSSRRAVCSCVDVCVWTKKNCSAHFRRFTWCNLSWGRLGTWAGFCHGLGEVGWGGFN